MKHEPAKWRADYQRDGFLVVEDVVDAPTLAMLRAELDAITADPEALPPRLRRFVELERDYLAQPAQQKYNTATAEQVGLAVRNIMELPLFSKRLARFIAHPPLLDMLEVLFDSTEFHFHNYKCIIKSPRVGSAFRWHRDLPYLYHTTANLITAMVCVDPMTEENGATVVLPGTHRVPVEQVTAADMEVDDADLPADAPRVTVTCPAGSAVLFHVNILHGGGPNRSPSPRRNVIGIWAGPDAWPITASRYAYGELCPRSTDPIRQQQMQMTFG